MLIKQETEELVPGTYTWKIRDFSELEDIDEVCCQEFDVAGLKWYPSKTLIIFKEENPFFLG